MKSKMITRTFTVLGYEKFHSDLNPISKEYTDEMSKWGQDQWKNAILTEEQDLQQKEICKNQILEILRTTREDAVYDAMTDFFTKSCFEERIKSTYLVEPIKKLLINISKIVGKSPIRIAAWDFFADKLNYSDYQDYITKIDK